MYYEVWNDASKLHNEPNEPRAQLDDPRRSEQRLLEPASVENYLPQISEQSSAASDEGSRASALSTLRKTRSGVGYWVT